MSRQYRGCRRRAPVGLTCFGGERRSRLSGRCGNMWLPPQLLQAKLLAFDVLLSHSSVEHWFEVLLSRLAPCAIQRVVKMPSR